MIQNRILIVSNRLPIQASENAGKLTYTESSGGLVSSITSYLKKVHLTSQGQIAPTTQWIGTSDLSEAKFIQLEKNHKLSNANFELNPVYIPETTKDKFYNGFCNNAIWPLFHYFPSYVKFKNDYYEHYLNANRLFCEKIVSIYQPGDLIWIHDYHLMPLAGMLRELLPNAIIGFFLHIPFPSFELFRILPNKWRREILKGLLGADLIGFHTNDYMQHFLKSVQNILGYDHSLGRINVSGRSVLVDTFPISIDFTKFNLASNQPEVFKEANSIKKELEGKQLIISVDRLDYAKALTNRLESFELFLENFPDYKEKVTYIMLVVPSRDIITKYKENKREIERLVSRINGKYGNVGWTPVVYQYKSLDFTQLTALYFVADVALITPIRDGMNLVAKEFISTRLDKRGVLILGETAGASAELSEALIVNPTDRQQIAEALHEALTMPPEEQIRRNEIMQNRIRNYDVVKWVEDFVTQLKLQKLAQEKLKIKELTPKTAESISEDYARSQKRLILLDYDGTLTPIVRHPNMASPSNELIELLVSLAKDDKNNIVLISGRPRETLARWFSNVPISFVAEHGGFYKLQNKEWTRTTEASTSWKASILTIFNSYLSRSPGSSIEEKELSIAWHYRNVVRELGFIRSRELLEELKETSSQPDYQVLDGNMVIEARMKGVNKGAASQLFLNKRDYDFILAIGDDKTDEEMFEVLPQSAISIRVGLTQSHAKYNLSQQEGVIRFLSKLLHKSNQPKHIPLIKKAKK